MQFAGKHRAYNGGVFGGSAFNTCICSCNIQRGRLGLKIVVGFADGRGYVRRRDSVFSARRLFYRRSDGDVAYWNKSLIGIGGIERK